MHASLQFFFAIVSLLRAGLAYVYLYSVCICVVCLGLCVRFRRADINSSLWVVQTVHTRVKIFANV